MKAYILLLSFFICSQLSAQFYPEYVKTFDGIDGTEYIYDTYLDEYGNTYTVGNYRTTEFGGEIVESENAHSNGFLAKYDENGDLLWFNKLSSQNSSSVLEIELFNGVIYISGTWHGASELISSDNTKVQFPEAVGNSDNFIAACDTLGIFDWVKTFGNPAYDVLSDMEVTAEGIFLLGRLNEGDKLDFEPSGSTVIITGEKVRDGYLVSYDLTGTYQWHHHYTAGSGYTYMIDIDSDAEYLYTLGFQQDSLKIIQPSKSDIVTKENEQFGRVVSKVRQDTGELIWAKVLITNNSIANFSSIEIEDNNIYLTGIFNDTLRVYDNVKVDSLISYGSFDVFLAQYDTSSTFNWLRQIGSGEFDDVAGLTTLSGSCFIDIKKSGDSLVISNKNPEDKHTLYFEPEDNKVIMKFGSSGNIINYIRLGTETSSVTSDVLHSFNNKITLSGSFSDAVNFNQPYHESKNHFEMAGRRIFVSGFTEDYTFNWQETVGEAASINPNRALGTCLDEIGNVYTVGYFENDLLIAGASYSSRGQKDMYIVKQDALGNVLWVRTFGGTLDEEARKLTFAEGKLYVTGFFEGICNFSYPYIAGFFELTSAGGRDVFVLKLDAETGLPDWIRRGGGTQDDEANDIVYEDEAIYIGGNFRLTSNFNTPSSFGTNELVSKGGDDAFLMKMFTSGSLAWLKRAGGTGYDEGKAVGSNASGVFLGGSFSDLADFNTPSSQFSNTFQSLGDRDVFVVKFDHSGTLGWIQKAGSTLRDRLFGLDCSASSVFATGIFEDTLKVGKLHLVQNKLISEGNRDAFILSFTSQAGLVNWYESISGPEDILGTALAFGDGEVFVGGFYEGTAHFSSSDSLISDGDSDVFLSRFESNGNHLQSFRAGGYFEDDLTDLSVSDSVFSLSGNFFNYANFNTPSHFDYNVIAAHVTSLGFSAKGSMTPQIDYAFTDGGDTGGNTNLDVVGSDESGNIYLAGDFSKEISNNGVLLTGSEYGQMIMKLNKQGKTKWITPVYSSSSMTWISIAANDNYVFVSGYFKDTIGFNHPEDLTGNSLISTGYDDAFLLCLDASDGNLVWSKRMGGSNTDRAKDLSLEGNYLYILGSFDGTIDLGTPANPSHNSLTSQNGSTDLFLCKFDFNGGLIWSRRMGGDNYDGYGVLDTYNDTVYIFGTFTDQMNFNTPFSSSSNTLQAVNNGSELFLAEFSSGGQYQWSRTVGGAYTNNSFDIAAGSSGIYVSSIFDVTTVNFSHPYVAGMHEYTLTDYYAGFLAKFSLTGDFQNVTFAQSNGEVNTGEVEKVRVFLNGSEVLWVCDFNDTLLVSKPGSATEFEIEPEYTSEDFFVASIATNGEVNWAQNTGSEKRTEFREATFSKNALHIIGELDLEGTPLFNKNVFYDIIGLKTDPNFLMKLSFCENGLVLISPVDDTEKVTLTKITSQDLQASNKVSEEAKVQYLGQFVELLPGFEADSGTVFMAETGGCPE